MYPIILSILAFMGASLHLFFSQKRVTKERAVELLLSYILPLNIGVTCLIGFTAHLFFGPQTAALIGWPPHNPFQAEVAMGNLGMAITGILCIWWRKGFWLATILFAAVFFLGAAGVHLVEVARGNTAPYNSGLFLYVGDIALPLLTLFLGFLYARYNKLFKAFTSS